MAKIQKIELNLGQKIANPFKTTRKSTTNPFKYSNFEGNTLQFADVFEGFEPQKINKLKMISASVAGTMTKIRSSITEPIVNFVNRMRTDISNGWNMTKDIMNMDIADIGRNITGSISNIGKSIKDKINLPDLHLTELNNSISEGWNVLINKISNKRITKDTTVAELRSMWEEEIALASKKEVA